MEWLSVTNVLLFLILIGIFYIGYQLELHRDQQNIYADRSRQYVSEIQDTLRKFIKNTR